MSKSAHPLSGKFIVFDGPDGSGKSTQVQRFALWCSKEGLSVKEVREPGGTLIGEQVRQILLDPANRDMTLACEMLLYMASRAQLMKQEIIPALKMGEVVIADRFVSATLVYQGIAGGLPLKWIEHVAEVALGGCVPDLTLIFDVDNETASKRLNPLLDRMEQKGDSFHKKVQKGFVELANSAPELYELINARQDIDHVEAAVRTTVSSRFCL